MGKTINLTIPSEINNWDIEYDPYNYFSNENWFKTIEVTEDILQVVHTYNGYIIDLGCYNNIYKIIVIKDFNWEKPIEVILLNDLSEINKLLRDLVIKYVN